MKKEKPIEEEMKEPFDYGDERYLKLIKRIHENREKYRAEQEVKQVLKYKMLKKEYE